MLAPNPLATTSWPIAGDVPDLLAIVQNQAETIQDQEGLLHAYQGVLTAAQNPPAPAPATGNGAVTAGATTSVAVSGVIGTIVNGAIVGGTGLSTAPTVLGLISGTAGGNGTYLFSSAVTFAVVTALSFQAPPPPEFSTWPVPQDAPTLDLLVQQQTAVIRVQTALLQHYQDVLNTSETPAPPAGP